MMKKRKIVIVIDLILMIGIAAAIIGTYVYATSQQVQFSPLKLDETSVLFWTDADKVFVSKDIELTSRDEYILEDSLIIELSKGEYYLGFQSESALEIKYFDVRNKVSLLFRQTSDGSFEVLNAGTEDYSVAVQNPNGKEEFVKFVGGKNG